MNRKQSKNKNKKSSNPDTLKGVLDITRSGMGFVVVENNPEDILVRPTDFNTAMHGDIVRVKVRGDQSRSGRKQGEITEVVKRKQMEFMGRVELSKNFAFFIVNSDKPVPDIYIPLNKLNNAANGDQAIVRIVEWEKNKKPVGEVIQVMDASDVNDQAMKEILMENGFPLMFPDTVIEESERIPDLLPAAEIKKRRDFREILTFTIDPVDAKDFDDAISFQVLKNGNYEIGVHIADVSFYVEPDTELDREAYDRATSVYLPDRVSPMLPERISNELCSLRPREDKFTFSAVFEVTDEGEIKSQWFGRTVIHSDHRFTYEEAQEIIEQEDGPYKDQILLLNGLAQKYRKSRFKKGAINFSSQEVRFKLDEKGKPIGIVIKESKEAHQLIEEFMLLANRAVAELVGKVKIDKQDLPFPYRIHDTPDEVKLTPFITFAKKYGHTFDTSSPEGISKSFNQMLEDVKGKPEQHVLEQLGIRTMAKAIYTTENIGHYGLGFEHYCHFTSPIRRYPDVLVHRILQDVLDKKAQPDKKLEQKCKHCSDKERSAMEAERAANKYKQVEYMQDYLGEEFEGVISGVSSFGFWVETVQHKCEGLVSISSLQDYDDFRQIEGEYSLVGLRSGRKFRMGDKVTIKIVAANLTKRQLDYEWVLAQSGSSGVKKDPVHPVAAEVPTEQNPHEIKPKIERLSDTEKYAGKRADGKKRGAVKQWEKNKPERNQQKEHVGKHGHSAPVPMPADRPEEVKAEVEVWIPENRSSVPDESKGQRVENPVSENRKTEQAKSVGYKETSQKVGGHKEGSQKEGSHKEGGRNEAGQKEGGHKEGGRKEGGRKEGSQNEGGQKESGRRESNFKENSYKESGQRESGQEGTGGTQAKGHFEPGKSKSGQRVDKPGKGKSNKNKSGKPKTNKDAGKPKAGKHKTKGTTPKSKKPKL